MSRLALDDKNDDLPGSDPGEAPFLTGRGLTKRYGPIEALKGIDVDFRRGEVHALVGENGAGKSTLKKVLCGEVVLDEGALTIAGEPIRLGSPAEAHRAGIAVVHQHFPLAETLTVAANVFLGEAPLRGPRWMPMVDHARMVQGARAALETFSLSHLANRRVRELSVAERQVVAIATATRRNAKMIILDEPTSSLDASEVEVLFKTVRKLRDDGTSVVFITHSMEEVLAIADRITVLRDGNLIETLDAGSADTGMLVRLIVGRELAKGYPKSGARKGASMLEVSGTNLGAEGTISLTAHKGECVGVPAHMGSGVDTLLRQISGQTRTPRRTVTFDDIDLSQAALAKRIKAGLCLVPGDATQEGLIPQLSIEDNILLPNTRRFASFGILQQSRIRALCWQMIEALDIRPASPTLRVTSLSGGNRQKVVIAKWLAAGARLLVLDDPTKGVDVGAKMEIYAVINGVLERGDSVVLASTDLDELMGLSDRILVIRDGAIAGEHAREQFNKVDILEQLVGAVSHLQDTPRPGQLNGHE